MVRFWPLALPLFLLACTLESSALPRPPGPDTGADTSTDVGTDTGDLDSTVPLDSAAPPDSATDTAIDAGDGGATTMYDLAWGPGVAVPGVAISSSCETDPVLTPDERWLFVSRPERSFTRVGCFAERRFHVYEWNAGAPVLVQKLPLFDSAVSEESNPHALDGTLFGRPGDTLLIHTAERGELYLAYGWLSPDAASAPTVAAGNGRVGLLGGAPCTNADGDRLLFLRDGELFEALGAAPDAYGPGTSVFSDGREASDGALSPDGRVLVFGRPRASDGWDLVVTRRREVTDPWEPEVVLPSSINGASGGADPFISTSGDLLYTADDGTEAYRVYIARRVAP